MVDSVHRVAAPDALRARGPFYGVADDELIGQWVSLVEKASGVTLDGDEPDIMRNTITELMRGVTPLGELSDEATQPVDPEVTDRLRAVSKEIGARTVWHNLPPQVDQAGRTEGTE